jgi:hypothetical protein
MLRILIAILALATIMVSCGEQQQVKSSWENVPVLTVANFDSLAGNYIGKEIQLEGLVDHVCQHGGKRMFLVHENSPGRVKVTTGENIPSFDIALVGSTVAVKGIIEELRIDEQYLQEWEKELNEQEATEATEEQPSEEVAGQEPAEEAVGEQPASQGQGQGTHEGMGEKADQGLHNEAYDQIDAYRQQIAGSEKGYISFFSVVCSEFKELTQ